MGRLYPAGEMTGAYFNLLPLRQNSVASNPPTNGVVGERKELWLLVTGIKGSVYDWQVMRKSGVIRGNRSAGTFVAGGNTRPAHMLETMNFIQVPLKMTLRFMSRNKVFAVLVGISGLAGVLSLVVWRSTAHLEQDIHQDIDSLRGNMRNMASTLQDINSRLSNSNKQDADDVAKPMYWLEAKTVSSRDVGTHFFILLCFMVLLLQLLCKELGCGVCGGMHSMLVVAISTRDPL